MDFCYVLTQLLDDGDTADNGQGLHLALSNVNDAEDHENQGSKAAKSGYDTADETDKRNKGKNTACYADNDFCQEQNQSLISVELCERGLACCKSDYPQNTDVAENTKYLIIRVHIYYLLKYTSRSRWRHKPTTKISHGLHISYNKMRLLSTKSVKYNVNYTKKLKISRLFSRISLNLSKYSYGYL